MADIPWGPSAVGRLDRPTSDGRVVEQAGFTVRTLPLPMDWQELTAEGHDRAVTVGRIDDVQVTADGTVMASGVWLDPAIIPAVDRAKYLADQRVVYPSMEPAGCAMEYRWTGGGEPYYTEDGMQDAEPGGEVCVFTAFELAKVSLVSVQAFPDLWITDAGQAPAVSLVASVRSEGWADMPVAKADTEWDGQAAADRVFEWATQDGETDWDAYSRAFLYRDDDADPETRGAYKLGVADVRDGDAEHGELMIVPKAVYAVAGVLNGARGGADIPADQQDELKSVVTGLYKHISGVLDDDTIEAPFSLVACAADRPPVEWFTDPGLMGPTPITITEDGRIFGHIGLHGVPHRGLPGRVGIPRSMSQYREFLLGETMTAEGIGVPTGKITIGGGHADGQLGMRAAVEHYDDVSTTVATVAAGDDEFGVWVAGAIKAGTPDALIDELRQSPPSGDWRTDVLGNLELITVHSVNTPGFPVYRVGMDDKSGYSLVASSGLVERAEQAGAPPARTIDPAYIDMLAAQLSARLTGTAPRAGFASVPAGEDLRAEFESAGVPWPTITATVGGVELPPFEVAEDCVRGMLAQAAGGVESPDMASLESGVAKLREQAQAQARARLALAKGRCH
jgi:hypothetical protein